MGLEIKNLANFMKNMSTQNTLNTVGVALAVSLMFLSVVGLTPTFTHAADLSGLDWYSDSGTDWYTDGSDWYSGSDNDWYTDSGDWYSDSSDWYADSSDWYTDSSDWYTDSSDWYSDASDWYSDSSDWYTDSGDWYTDSSDWYTDSSDWYTDSGDWYTNSSDWYTDSSDFYTDLTESYWVDEGPASYWVDEGSAAQSYWVDEGPASSSYWVDEGPVYDDSVTPLPELSYVRIVGGNDHYDYQEPYGGFSFGFGGSTRPSVARSSNVRNVSNVNNVNNVNNINRVNDVNRVNEVNRINEQVRNIQTQVATIQQAVAQPIVVARPQPRPNQVGYAYPTPAPTYRPIAPSQPTVTVASSGVTGSYGYVNVGSIPYTGTNDVAYVFAMIATLLGSGVALVLYKGGMLTSLVPAFAVGSASPTILHNEIVEEEDEATEDALETNEAAQAIHVLSLEKGEDGPKLSFVQR